jgi:hypothetical protein
MVSIVPNWGEFTGEVVGVRQDGGLPGYAVIEIKLLEKKQHAGFPLLIFPNPPAVVDFLVHRTFLERWQLAPGEVISGLGRAGGLNQYFIQEESIQRKG